jgi:hypothetical protein
MASCTDDLDTPVSLITVLKILMELLFAPQYYTTFLLKENAMFTLASYSTMDQFFEIYSQYDVELIAKESKDTLYFPGHF